MILTVKRADVRNTGKWLVSGAAEYLSGLFLWAVVVVLVVHLLVAVAGGLLKLGPIDDSDLSWGRHSGFEVRRDALTGCEYLEARSGVTPRLGRDGKQVCR